MKEPLETKTQLQIFPWWQLVMIGLIAGLLSGAFGVGGGILIVPALVLLLGMQQKIAHGTSLAAVVPISVIGTISYLASGDLNLLVGLLLAAGTVTGATFGARLLDRLSNVWLRWAFIAIMFVSAVRLFFESPDRSADFILTGGVIAGLLLLGLITGVLSGLLGVGGGVIMVPALVILFNMSDVSAKGVSLLVIIPTGIVATFLSLRRGNVDLRSASFIGLSGTITTVLGTFIAHWLSPRVASITFALFLLFVTVRLAFDAIKRARAGTLT